MPCPSGCVAGWSYCVCEFRLYIAPSNVLHCPMLGFSVASTTLAAGLGLSWVPCPTFCRRGFCTSVGGSACALQPLAPSYRVVLTEATGLGYPALLSAGGGFVPRSVARLAPCSRWRPLTGWSSLKLRVLGGSWFSPLCSPGRRSASRSTCSASCQQVVFWAWSLLLRVRLRPLPDASLGALWLPVCLLWSSLQLRVGESSSLSAWSFPFRGLSPFSLLFLSWRPCRSRSLIPSLAPSWWWPCPLLRWALLMLSGYALSVPSAVSLRRSR